MRSNRLYSFFIVIITYVLAYYAAIYSLDMGLLADPLWNALFADVIATIIVFIMSMIFRNSSLYDPYWSVAPVLVIYFFLHLAPEGNATRQLLMLGVMWLWAIRLTLNWARGWPGLVHEDWRYVDLAKKTGVFYPLVSLSGIHLFPTVLVFMGCIPVFYAAQSTAPLNFLDYLAVFVAILGTVLELIADEQLKVFVKTNTDKTAVMTRGIWAYSRHPNYLGEITFWLGLFIFALAVDPSAYWWTGVGFLAMLFLFVGISIPMMDKHHLAKRPKYQEVMDQIPGLLPLPGKKFKATAIILISLTTVSLSAQAPTYDLNACLELALKNNADVRKMDLTHQSRMLELDQSKKKLLPEVSSRVNYLWYWNDLPTYYFPGAEGNILSGGASDGPYAVGLGLPQNLFVGFDINKRLYDQRIWHGKAAIETMTLTNSLEYKKQRNETIYTVANSYYRAIGLKKNASLLLANQEWLEQMSSTLAVQVEQGFAPETALLEVNLKKKELALKLIDLENGYSQLLRYIQMLVGLAPTGEMTLEASGETAWLTQVTEIDKTKESTEAQLLSQKKTLNELMYKVESADYLPSVDLNADFQWQAQRENFGFFDGNEWQNINLLGLDINIPIYSGGNKTVAKQQLVIENQKLDIDRTQLYSYQELSRAKANEDYKSLVERLKVTKEYLELRVQMYNLTKLKYEQEVSTMNELMEAQVARQSAELDFETTKNELILAGLEVLKANNQMEVLLP
ncbi:MAG: DUF1295 domain-containing protein [Cyclobacteriaceae bacterium]